MKQIRMMSLPHLLLFLAPTAFAQLTFPPPPSPLVTGNGHGFAVFSIQQGFVSKFYAHPYRYEKPDLNDPFGEGVETTNFLRHLNWRASGEAPSPVPQDAVEYLNDSQIVTWHSSYSDRHFFSPFGLARNAFVTIDESSKSCLDVQWQNPIESRKTVVIEGRSIEVFKFKGAREILAAIPLARRNGQHPWCSSSAWAFVSVDIPSEINRAIKDTIRWQAKLSPRSLLKRELRQVEAWRKAPTFSFASLAEKKLWRQSEIVLRMAQSREPNRADRFGHGLILASLPEGMWFVAWARDMALATIALIRSGHKQEAKWALEAYFNARPTGVMKSETRGWPYQISVVRYWGNGTEEPFFTMEGAANIEFDNWGLVLWALAEYVETFSDNAFLKAATYRGRVYDVARDFIVRPLVGNLDAYQNGWIVTRDTSIWEERQEDKKYFAFSTAAAQQGLERFAALAAAVKDEKWARKCNEVAALLRDGFHSAFVRDGYIHGTLERGFKNDIDAAVLDAINFGVVRDRDIISTTHKQMELLRMPTGGFRRVRGDAEYEKHEFLYANFAIARNHLLLDEPETARNLIEPMIQRSAKDHFLIPEMYISQPSDDFQGKVGEPTGSIPMVGYGAGIFLITEKELRAKRPVVTYSQSHGENHQRTSQTEKNRAARRDSSTKDFR